VQQVNHLVIAASLMEPRPQQKEPPNGALSWFYSVYLMDEMRGMSFAYAAFRRQDGPSCRCLKKE
jgi:hypothetical protein